MATLNTVTSSTRPASPTAGEAYFETDTNKIIVWNGTSWTEIVSDGTLSSFSNAYSVSFDGSNDYVVVPQSSDLNISGSMSISFWFQRGRAGHSSFEGVLNKNNSSSNVNYSVGFRPSGEGNKLGFWDGVGGNLVTTTGFTSTTDYVHACFVNDGGTWYWYINGSQDSTGTGCNVTSTTGDLVLGAYDAGSPSFFYSGNLDEISVFDTALSASNVTSIYNSGTPNDISSLSPVSWWRMGDNDNGTGTTITDQGSGSNDGTLTNGPTFSSSVPS